MYASIAGLKAHMQKLTVIGHNVANVNTAAYKKQRTVFRDSIYSMYSGGSNGSQSVGGKNPSQLGYGSLVASIDLDMSSATYNPGNPMDCAIVGDGFFMVGTKDQASNINPWEPESFKSLKLTRTGDFRFAADGYLTDGQGNVVYGFLTTAYDTDGKPIVSDQLVPIRYPKMEKAVVRKDDGTVVTPDEDGNYDETIMDADGNLTETYKWSYTVRYPVDKPRQTGDAPVDPDGEQQYIAIEDYWPVNGEGNKIPDKNGRYEINPLAYAEMEGISIDNKTGCISGTTREGGIKVTIGYLAMGIVTNPNGVTHTGENYYTCGAGAGDMRITMLGGVNEELGISQVNGSIMDQLRPANIAEGENPPDLASVTSAGDVELMSGFLEAPNVDLATEISELITTQRGYQANTRIVTVTDSMLEELVNMKR